MSLAYSIVSFCIDISPSMGSKRTVVEEVNKTLSQGHQAGQTSSVRERETTDLEWVNEFVAKKIQAYILAGLKTAKIHIALFGSPRTNNTLLKTTEVKDGYEGIDEIFLPSQPSIGTLELLRCLRATTEDEEPYPADAMDALVATITTQLNRKISETTDRYKRTIYLITDGKSAFSKDFDEDVQKKLIEHNITLKVVGIDFDDAEHGYKEEDKPAVKAENEAWWHSFLSKLPNSGIATAAYAIEQASLPSIHLQASAPNATSLTFGDPESRHSDATVLDIPVKLYKATATARPLSQKRLSKVAQESAAARSQSARLTQERKDLKPSSTPGLPTTKQNDDGNGNGNDEESGLTYAVQMQKKYFIKDDLEMIEGGIGETEPLPEGAEKTFAQAYKLGATLVAINEDLQRGMDTQAGMEIIQFTAAKRYRRQYHMAETWFVFASDGNAKAQLGFSSLINAMARVDKYAIVRYVRSNGGEPKLGLLAPILQDQIDSVPCECMAFVEVPFRQDLKRFTFPPLDRVITREGQELTEHTSLPSEEMQKCMDEMVDSLDLMDAAAAGCDEDDDDDNKDGAEPWFSCVESFNPAIHLTKEAVSWRVFHPDDKALPKAHPEVTKFLEAPEKVTKRVEGTGKRCREEFQLGAYYPTDKRDAKRQAEERARARGEGEGEGDGEVKELNLEGVMDEEVAAEAAEAEANKTAPQKAIAQTREQHTSDTDDDEEEAISLHPNNGSTTRKATQKKSQKDSLLDPENILADFEKKLESGKAKVEDLIDALNEAIVEKVMSSFGSNSYSEARDMLKVMRKGAIEYEEAERYNRHLRSLKKLTLDESASRPRDDFWDSRIRGRRDLSLIADGESYEDALGVTEEEASSFIDL